MTRLEVDRGEPASARRRGRPANSSTDDTVAVVLIAARRQFAAHGYSATTNHSVAKAAGLAHTAIYNHFGSKARLFTAVFLDVQDVLIAQLRRSVDESRDVQPLPRALFDAIEALRQIDPSYVEFLASMYVEVRRHRELREVFQAGRTFPIVDTLREMAGDTGEDAAGGGPDDSMWFWITFALGLAQLSALADNSTFDATLEAFRRRFASPTTTSDPDAPTGSGDSAA